MKIQGVNKTIVIDFFSVLFAVFLGLILNQWNENRNHKNLGEQMKNNIIMEVTKNQVQIDKMIQIHQSTLKSIDTIRLHIKGSDVSKDLKLDLKLDLKFKMLNNSSWETAKLTLAISYMDIDEVNLFARVYKYQEYYEMILKDIVLSANITGIDESDAFIIQKSNRILNKIVPLEKNLSKSYERVLREVGKKS